MKRISMETVVGIFVAAGIVCIGYMTISLGNVPLFSGGDYILFARFASVSGLREGSPVEIYGIPSGRVNRLAIDSEKEMAVVEMKIKESAAVFDDGSAAIKTYGLIGDKYIKIEPGGSGEKLANGGWITETTVPMDIDDLIGKAAFGDVGRAKGPDNTE